MDGEWFLPHIFAVYNVPKESLENRFEWSGDITYDIVHCIAFYVMRLWVWIDQRVYFSTSKR